MAHRYGQPVAVTLTADQLTAFQWRGGTYPVVEILATWHLRDRWWEQAIATPASSPASDRTYYRVRCADEQIFDLYYDASSDLWMLDRAHD